MTETEERCEACYMSGARVLRALMEFPVGSEEVGAASDEAYLSAIEAGDRALSVGWEAAERLGTAANYALNAVQLMESRLNLSRQIRN